MTWFKEASHLYIFIRMVNLVKYSADIRTYKVCCKACLDSTSSVYLEAQWCLHFVTVVDVSDARRCTSSSNNWATSRAVGTRWQERSVPRLQAPNTETVAGRPCRKRCTLFLAVMIAFATMSACRTVRLQYKACPRSATISKLRLRNIGFHGRISTGKRLNPSRTFVLCSP